MSSIVRSTLMIITKKYSRIQGQTMKFMKWLYTIYFTVRIMIRILLLLCTLWTIWLMFVDTMETFTICLNTCIAFFILDYCINTKIEFKKKQY